MARFAGNVAVGAAAALAGAMAWSAPARADTPEALCGSPSFPAVASNTAVSDAAGNAERALSRRGASDAGDNVLSTLDVPLAGTVRPDAE